MDGPALETANPDDTTTDDTGIPAAPLVRREDRLPDGRSITYYSYPEPQPPGAQHLP